MMFRNSLRILFSNFSMVWKILVYYLVCIVTTFSVATIFSLPLFNTLEANNFFDTLKTEYATLGLNFNVTSILNSIYAMGQEFFSIIGSNINVVLPSLIMVLIVVFVFGGFLFGLSKLAITEVLNGYMSSSANYTFMGAYVRTFKKSAQLQLTKLLINLPITIVILTIIALTLPLLGATNAILAFLAPFLIILVATLLVSLHFTAFCGVTPAVCVHDAPVFKGYQLGFKAVARRFYKTLSTSFGLILTIFSLNLFFFSLTSGVSLVITLPASIFLLAIFPMVMYYGSMGMRYYVDPETILSPKKLEEQDKMNKAKFII